MKQMKAIKQIKNKKIQALVKFFQKYELVSKNYDICVDLKHLCITGYKFVRIGGLEIDHHFVIDLEDKINQDENSDTLLINFMFELDYLYDWFGYGYNDCALLNRTNELSTYKPGVHIYKVFIRFNASEIIDLLKRG